MPGRRLIEAPIAPECRACVVIPVRDEAANLGATLRALADQVGLDGRPLPRSFFEVVVLANNCRDESAELARRFADAEPGLALHVAEVEIVGERAHVGTARRLLMDEACCRLASIGRGRGVIASTDGDTRVGPAWLAATLAEVAAGADAVGGDIRTDRSGRRSLGRAARRAYLVDVAHRRLVEELEARLDPDPADPWPRHHHHTGASLAVTAAAYRLAGGLPPLPCSEDLALVAALRRLDLTVRHADAVRVVTSARRIGRAAGGMADTLRRWSLEGDGPRVEHPAATEARALARRTLRRLWRDRRPGRSRAELAGSLGLEPDHLIRLIEAAPTFGRLLESTRLDLARGGEGIEAAEAVKLLRARLTDLRRGGPAPLPGSSLLEQVDPIVLLPSPAPMG